MRYRYQVKHPTADQKAAAHAFYANESGDAPRSDLDVFKIAAANGTPANDEAPIQGAGHPVSDVVRFALAGRAILTVVSRKTGTRFTFRVRQPDAAAPHFISVLSGQNNDSDYAYVGSLFADGTYRHGKKSRIGPDAPSAKAAAWFFNLLGRGRVEDIAAQCDVYHEGRCGRCGRRLTVPESIETGLGPECAGRV